MRKKVNHQAKSRAMAFPGIVSSYVDVEPNIGDLTPKMDGENNGKPYEEMDDLGPIFGNTHVVATQIFVIFNPDPWGNDPI